MELHQKLLSELKCVTCGLYLSIPPVFITSTGDNICGRCPTNYATEIRNTAYETIASTTKFPCRNQNIGCEFSPKWGKVKDHEDSCDFRQIICPVLGVDCSWKGSRVEIEEHFNEKHENLISTKQPLIISYDLNKDCERNILLSIFGFLFLIQVKISVEQDMIHHCVRYIGNPKCIPQFYCTIKISKNAAAFTDILPIHPQEDDIKICEQNSHECEITGIQSVLKGSEDIKFTMNINKKIDLDLLNEMKCLICKSYTKPPISHIEDSPVCAQCAPSGCTTDPDLTSMGLQLLYPCTHKNKGCCAFDNLKYIWKHEIFSCKFFFCFICNQDVNGTIDTHFKKKHSVNIITLEEMLNIELTDCENWFLITSEDKKFLGQYMFDENVLYIMLCSNLSSDLLHKTTCNLKMIDFKSKKTVVKSMTQKLQDAFDWSISVNCSNELFSMINGNRINIQFELFKTVSAE